MHIKNSNDTKYLRNPFPIPEGSPIDLSDHLWMMDDQIIRQWSHFFKLLELLAKILKSNGAAIWRLHCNDQNSKNLESFAPPP